jgi:hypothetical protein
MQFTALAGGGTTRGTSDRGYLFGREFALLHSRRMRLQLVANLFNSGQYRMPGDGYLVWTCMDEWRREFNEEYERQDARGMTV